jgi:putative phosphoesterase
LRVAALADVHGNLPALEAVLADVRAERVDLVISCGDLAGAFGSECLDRLLAFGDHLRLVRGNADHGVNWPLTVEVSVDQLGRVVFCHGSPRSEHEILTRISPAERVSAALEGVEADLVVGGHTHVQFDRSVAGRRLVNVGSVGMPYEGRQGAFWALLGPDVQLRRTDYDIEAAAAALEATGFPGAADQAGWLRQPPDPGQVSEYFEDQAECGPSGAARRTYRTR